MPPPRRNSANPKRRIADLSALTDDERETLALATTNATLPTTV